MAPSQYNKYKESYRRAQRRYWLKNREKHNLLLRNRRLRIREWYQELKEKGFCKDCKQKWPYYVLDFHHRKREDKLASVSTMVSTGQSQEKILEEIAKCDLICANCHRIREHGRSIPLAREPVLKTDEP